MDNTTEINGFEITNGSCPNPSSYNALCVSNFTNNTFSINGAYYNNGMFDRAYQYTHLNGIYAIRYEVTQHAWVLVELPDTTILKCDENTFDPLNCTHQLCVFNICNPFFFCFFVFFFFFTKGTLTELRKFAKNTGNI